MNFKSISQDDFQIGMLLEAITSDPVYNITQGEAYEIIDIDSTGLNFINDYGDSIRKDYYTLDANIFDYFKIIQANKKE